MTDSIDLDELDVSTDSDAEKPNRGDWFWKGEGDPEDETLETRDGEGENEAETGAELTDADTELSDSETLDPETSASGAASDSGATPRDSDADHSAIPRVPRTNDDAPVGIPIQGGGAGGAATGSVDDDAAAEGEQTEPEPTGPHGSGPSEMTMALTYEAVKRLENPAAAFADAEGWTDWLGIVGDVDAHVITKFQRESVVDADFFNGTGTGPAERLAGIDERSMFFAERMVVVGVAGVDDYIAEESGWEFVPLETAAEKAGWPLVDGNESGENGGGENGDVSGSDDSSVKRQ
ncbi:DUF7124 domain-containing protein [Haloprofundus salilacus]|uniref:DUF7124 domain-containing protein n=1 Tax=Haloprofundus salilacus TaxID=2876190 RepID=UPI001CC9A454|nr:hypothetical protein [Haloprofundus salilacus]